MTKGSQIIQTCDPNDKTTQTVGLFAVGAVKSLGDAQKAVKAWASGNCVSVEGSTTDVDLGILVAPKVAKRSVELRSRINDHHAQLFARADCKTTKVVSGDSCASLAKRCGVTAANFTKYNPGTNFCSKLAVNQVVCCSAGTLPDKKPKPLADGTCFTYSIKSGDSCYTLGQAYTLTETAIRSFNRNTWGWAGCDRLSLGQRICLSSGKNPMPLPVTGAVCGPLVPGTVRPSTAKLGWDLVNLNPCPLKACCSGFGFCGITGEFCTNTTAQGAGPGTYKAGTAGCVSNCGTKITGNTAKPAKFISVGYFQGYNVGRPCLNMDASKLAAKTEFTHMHFAFAGLTTSYAVTLQSGVTDQFNKFVAMKGPWKKIISLGGWADSTDAATFERYRYAMKAANREKFASSVLAFLNQYKLDGVDFDWEYPGSAASAGSSDSTADTDNYLAFLTLMRKKLGTSGKTMSSALPAAYWYLKPFPVAKMAPLLDYVIFMTYDLHGQWGMFTTAFSNLYHANFDCRLRQPVRQPRLPNRQLSSIPRQQDRDDGCPCHDHKGRSPRSQGHCRCLQLRPQLQDEGPQVHRTEMPVHRQLQRVQRRAWQVHRQRWIPRQRRNRQDQGQRHRRRRRNIGYHLVRRGFGLGYHDFRNQGSGPDGLGCLHGHNHEDKAHSMGQEPQLWWNHRLGCRPPEVLLILGTKLAHNNT